MGRALALALCIGITKLNVDAPERTSMR